jgi:hypothetical protein
LAGSDCAAIFLRDVLDHGFFPNARAPSGGKVPDDRPIDGVDQTDLLLGRSDTGRRDALLTFIALNSSPYAGSSSARILPTWLRAAVAGAGRISFRERGAAPHL